MFGAGEGGLINPPNPNRTFELAKAEIAVPNETAHALFWDLEVLVGMVKELPATTQANADALYTANKIVNTIRPDHPETLVAARAIAKEFFEARAKQGYAQHTITAVARSWATQCTLIETYPDYIFAASQAQQFEWLEQLYPKLLDRIKGHVQTGQFIPIGGTWVEMDCNIPSGEALCRQFLYGQHLFERMFGKRCSVFWLPDTFGYAAQLPQIVREAGLKYFFTQKLSWNNINKFPHTSFNWVGLDGTSVLTHFCPADTYTAGATVRDVTFSVTNNKDKEYSNQSLLLYGNGDGGGGPLIPMIERLQRMKAVEGLPATVQFGDPNDFYETLEKTSHDLVSWKGELYFELHRGTYTSVALVKRYNRMTELLMREVEMLISLNLARGTGFNNQFHDVLPGSSIGLVYVDAIKYYEDVVESATKIKGEALAHLLPSSASNSGKSTSEPAIAVFNATSWQRRTSVIQVDLDDCRRGFGEPAAAAVKAAAQQLSADKTKALVYGILLFAGLILSPRLTQCDGPVIISNEFLRATFDSAGRLTSLVDLEESRELVPPGASGNVFRYFEDIPLFWDAWDVEVYHLEKHWLAGVGSLSVLETGPLRAVLSVVHPLSKTSTLEQRIVLEAGSRCLVFENNVFWDENRKMLKVEFPWDISNDVATYETQFGFIQRPTHFNNSWDLARFEVCGHKFVDFSEFGYGVALLNDSKYGFSVHGNVMRMSLLRSPKAPDDNCDIGRHSFKFGIFPHKGSFHESQVVRAGYELNVPLTTQIVSGAAAAAVSASPSALTLFSVDKPNVVLDTVKPSEDGTSRRFVLRLYEAHGGRGTMRIASAMPILKAWRCNIMEDVKGPVELSGDKASFDVAFKPFEIISLLVQL
nr:Alpha-mannosidase 2C1 [Polyrhizophydium stewartii]